MDYYCELKNGEGKRRKNGFPLLLSYLLLWCYQQPPVHRTPLPTSHHPLSFILPLSPFTFIARQLNFRFHFPNATSNSATVRTKPFFSVVVSPSKTGLACKLTFKTSKTPKKARTLPILFSRMALSPSLHQLSVCVWSVGKKYKMMACSCHHFLPSQTAICTNKPTKPGFMMSTRHFLLAFLKGKNGKFSCNHHCHAHINPKPTNKQLESGKKSWQSGKGKKVKSSHKPKVKLPNDFSHFFPLSTKLFGKSKWEKCILVWLAYLPRKKLQFFGNNRFFGCNLERGRERRKGSREHTASCS